MYPKLSGHLVRDHNRPKVDFMGTYELKIIFLTFLFLTTTLETKLNGWASRMQ